MTKNVATLALWVACSAPACTLEPRSSSEFDSLPQDVIDELQDEDKLYGGDTQPDTNNLFPGVVLLEVEDGNCSATIVSPRHAITAAHCIDSDGAPAYISTPNIAWLRGVGTRHPSYKSDRSYDIAIVTFPDDVSVKREFSEIMVPIDLSNTWSFGGRIVTYVGFGADADGNWTDERMFGTSKANTCIAGLAYDYTFGPSICDYFGRAEARTASGDSGGATLTKNSRGAYVLSGVISGVVNLKNKEGLWQYFSGFMISVQVNQVLEFIEATAPEISATARL